MHLWCVSPSLSLTVLMINKEENRICSIEFEEAVLFSLIRKIASIHELKKSLGLMRERARARRRLFFVVSQLMLLLFERHQKQWAYGVRKDKNSGKKKHTRMKRASKQASKRGKGREENERKHRTNQSAVRRVDALHQFAHQCTRERWCARGGIGHSRVHYPNTSQAFWFDFKVYSHNATVLSYWRPTCSSIAWKSKALHHQEDEIHIRFFSDAFDRRNINTQSHKCHQIAWSFRFRRRTRRKRLDSVDYPAASSISSDRSARILRSDPFTDEMLSDIDEKKRMTSRSNSPTSDRSCQNTSFSFLERCASVYSTRWLSVWENLRPTCSCLSGKRWTINVIDINFPNIRFQFSVDV